MMSVTGRRTSRQFSHKDDRSVSHVINVGRKSHPGGSNVPEYDRPREVYGIGDCLKPRMLMNAIHDGFNVAVEIKSF